MAELAPADQAGDFRLGFAGDTFNTAWYLARLHPGAQISYLSAIGDDAISNQMRSALKESGISDAHIQIVPGGTIGLYLISLQNGERSFSYWRGQSAARQLAQDPAALDRAMAEADTIYFSGITLGILDEPSRESLLKALGKARAAGKTIAFDPNLRPRLWSSPQEMTDTIMQGAKVSDIALPSFEDEAEWFADADPDGTANRYSAAGVSTVVVKNGPDPVVCLSGTNRSVTPVSAIENVVDTTAAGDSFNAGFFTGLAQGLSIPASIELASQISGQVIGGKGALVPITQP